MAPASTRCHWLKPNVAFARIQAAPQQACTCHTAQQASSCKSAAVEGRPRCLKACALAHGPATAGNCPRLVRAAAPVANRTPPHPTPAGIELLKQYANVDTSYNLTPEELQAKVSLVDALIVRSGTKVRTRASLPACEPPCLPADALLISTIACMCAHVRCAPATPLGAMPARSPGTLPITHLLSLSSLAHVRMWALHLHVHARMRVHARVAAARACRASCRAPEVMLTGLPKCFHLSQVTRQVFESSKGRLKVVGRAGVGIDNVDLAAATEVRSERPLDVLCACPGS